MGDGVFLGGGFFREFIPVAAGEARAVAVGEGRLQPRSRSGIKYLHADLQRMRRDLAVVRPDAPAPGLVPGQRIDGIVPVMRVGCVDGDLHRRAADYPRRPDHRRRFGRRKCRHIYGLAAVFHQRAAAGYDDIRRQLREKIHTVFFAARCGYADEHPARPAGAKCRQRGRGDGLIARKQRAVEIEQEELRPHHFSHSTTSPRSRVALISISR